MSSVNQFMKVKHHKNKYKTMTSFTSDKKERLKKEHQEDLKILAGLTKKNAKVVKVHHAKTVKRIVVHKKQL